MSTSIASTLLLSLTNETMDSSSVRLLDRACQLSHRIRAMTIADHADQCQNKYTNVDVLICKQLLCIAAFIATLFGIRIERLQRQFQPSNAVDTRIKSDGKDANGECSTTTRYNLPPQDTRFVGDAGWIYTEHAIIPMIEYNSRKLKLKLSIDGECQLKIDDIEYRWTQRHVKMTLVNQFDVEKHKHRFEIYNRGYISIGAYRDDHIIRRHQCDIKFFGRNKPIERCLRETGFPSKTNFCARIRSKKSKIIYRLIGDYSHQLYHLAHKESRLLKAVSKESVPTIFWCRRQQQLDFDNIYGFKRSTSEMHYSIH